MTAMTKKKKQHINRELILGTGTILLVFPIMFSAIVSALVGVGTGISLLLSSGDTLAPTALTMILVYGTVLMVFVFATHLFIKRFQTLIDRKRDLREEQQRVTELLNMSSAVG